MLHPGPDGGCDTLSSDHQEGVPVVAYVSLFFCLASGVLHHNAHCRRRNRCSRTSVRSVEFTRTVTAHAFNVFCVCVCVCVAFCFSRTGKTWPTRR